MEKQCLYPVRRVEPKDIEETLGLALRVFEEYEVPIYPRGALERFRRDCIEAPEAIYNLISEKCIAFAAFNRGRVVGMIQERGGSHISMLFVDGAYHRQGIATALVDRMASTLAAKGARKITVNASPYGIPFYRHYGFHETAPEQCRDSFIFTPMEYEIK